LFACCNVVPLGAAGTVAAESFNAKPRIGILAIDHVLLIS
jgi:hypothetical protein